MHRSFEQLEMVLIFSPDAHSPHKSIHFTSYLKLQ